LGILAMIYISKPGEGSHLGYYAGLLLVVLWSGFIFRFSLKETIFYFISILILYNLIVILKQDIFLYDYHSIEFGMYIGNNFFLSSAGILSIIGTNYLNKYHDELVIKNQLLNNKSKELIFAKNKAEESDKLKTAFLANMSHEIRTPMNGIIGFSEMYLDKSVSCEDREQFAKIVIDSSQQLLRIVNDILDLSKIETNQILIKKETRDIFEIIHTTEQIFERKCKLKNIEFRTKYPNKLKCLIHTDHVRLSQIINNLLDNAIKFTHKGYIEFGFSETRGGVIFHVKDSGIGIPKKYQEIIFDRFRQIETSQSKKYGGTGLGLSICKHLTYKLGGQLWIDSEENKGSDFYLSIPYGSINESKQNINKINYKDSRLNGTEEKHIIIAEDEQSNFLYIETLLENENITIHHATNGQEAISCYEENKDIDLILMDIKMPKTNGIDAMKQIKEIDKNVTIIAQTAFAMAEDKTKMFEFGFDDYIAKPIESKDLFKMLNHHLYS
jgi:signal transduction histidine kinase